jgi:hypothetical protein
MKEEEINVVEEMVSVSKLNTCAWLCNVNRESATKQQANPAASVFAV